MASSGSLDSIKSNGIQGGLPSIKAVHLAVDSLLSMCSNAKEVAEPVIQRMQDMGAKEVIVTVLDQVGRGSEGSAAKRPRILHSESQDHISDSAVKDLGADELRIATRQSAEQLLAHLNRKP
mmetsp:Transcript_9592/g.15032  ORF Transcript_9592/g.15032 Transcript_9592/m.15032 type:complete len:122 (+) Transcript_9592:333-698(+)